MDNTSSAVVRDTVTGPHPDLFEQLTASGFSPESATLLSHLIAFPFVLGGVMIFAFAAYGFISAPPRFRGYYHEFQRYGFDFEEAVFACIDLVFCIGFFSFSVFFAVVTIFGGE